MLLNTDMMCFYLFFINKHNHEKGSLTVCQGRGCLSLSELHTRTHQRQRFSFHLSKHACAAFGIPTSFFLSPCFCQSRTWLQAAPFMWMRPGSVDIALLYIWTFFKRDFCIGAAAPLSTRSGVSYINRKLTAGL